LIDRRGRQIVGYRWNATTNLWIEEALNVLVEKGGFSDVIGFSYHGTELVAKVGQDGVRLVPEAEANARLRR
jgi:hypothetical protein